MTEPATLAREIVAGCDHVGFRSDQDYWHAAYEKPGACEDCIAAALRAAPPSGLTPPREAGGVILAADSITGPSCPTCCAHDHSSDVPGVCLFCAGPLSPNPHPDAGKPESVLIVGAMFACVPCLTKSRHGWAKRAYAAEARIRELEAAPTSPVAGAPEGDAP